MTVDRLAIEEQLLDAISIVTTAVGQGSQNIFLEITGYLNKHIPNVVMMIKKIDDTELKDVRNYFTIGFITTKDRYLIDALDIYFSDAGVFLRAQGCSCMIGDNVKKTTLTNAGIEAWIGLVVRGNPDLIEMLRVNREFNNGSKKSRK